MKAEIIAYTTALINVYAKEVKLNTNSLIINCNKRALDDLNDFLAFVEDVQEETGFVKVILENGEIDLLRKRIRELEDSCENMCEVDRNLQRKIEELKNENQNWRLNNTSLQKDNNNLKNKLKGRM